MLMMRNLEGTRGNVPFLTRNYSPPIAAVQCPFQSKQAAIAPSITFAYSYCCGICHWLLQGQDFVLQGSSHTMSALTGSCCNGENNILRVVVLLWSFLPILAVWIHAQFPLQDTQERLNQDHLCWLLHKAHIYSFVFYTELKWRWK